MFSPAVRPAPSHRPALLAFAIAVAALYFGKEILLPLALAVLLSFLLTPIVRRLETWKLGRVPSVIVVLILSASAFLGIGWIVANQLLDIITRLPDYETNIQRKIESFHGPRGGSLAKATDSVQELSKELSTRSSTQPPAELPRDPARTQRAAPPAHVAKPLPVEVIEPPPNALQSVRNLLGPLLAPVGSTVVVVVFTLVMLIKREDLRNRLLRLLGQGQLNLVTQAFDDATQRVSRYLRMQFVVNAVFAATITVGLHFIGLPGALLWGVLAGMLRFLPYIGPAIGGSIPFLISLAVFADWVQPLITLGLFLFAELLVAYVVEPWLYGKHTGISSLAILVAAAFWAAVWGPVGLILSTPLTVCLAVLGRYVPQFEFLYVMLGDEPVLSPETQFYQRLLAMDQQEARRVMELFLADKSLPELYDDVFIPALSMAETDRHKGELDSVRENFFMQSVGEFIAELANDSDPANDAGNEIAGSIHSATAPRPDCRVLCLPARDKADEVSAAMLAHLLESNRIPAVCMPAAGSAADILQGVTPQPNDIVCISALPPFAVLNARSLTKRLKADFPRLRILIGLWNITGGDPKARERMDRVFPGDVVTTLAQAVERVQQCVDSTPGLVETTS